jgi:hypothetical protein
VIVNYRPGGEAAQQWEWHADEVSAGEAELIEKRFEGTWDGFLLAVTQGSMRARRILLWHLLRSEHPTLKLDDLQFKVGELSVDFDKTELQQMYDEAVKRSDQIPEDKRELVLSVLRMELDKAGGAPAGKARSKRRA